MSVEYAAEPDEPYELERRFPIGWALFALVGAGNIAATVLMLLSQA